MKDKFWYSRIISCCLYFLCLLITVIILRFFNLFEMEQVNNSKLFWICGFAAILFFFMMTFLGKRKTNKKSNN